jgi:hypothetical protein
MFNGRVLFHAKKKNCMKMMRKSKQRICIHWYIVNENLCYFYYNIMKMRWDFETEYLLLKRILDRIDGMVTALCGCHVGPNINV